MSELRPKIKQLVATKFKVSGFFIKSDCLEYLIDLLEPLTTDDRQRWLRSIMSSIQAQSIQTLNVERKHLDIAIKACTNQGFGDDETVFSVINAFDIPRFKYHEDKKKFIIEEGVVKRSTFADVSMKADYISDRYAVLLQRTLRHPLFSKSSIKAPNFSLIKVEQLLSSSEELDIVVLGLLTQLTEGTYSIEDPTGAVPLDLSETTLHSGLFCEGCFVLAEGSFIDGTLRVSGLGFPPPELATSSRAFFGTANTWGGTSKTLLKYSKKLEEFEKRNEADGLIFLSDCWLDVQEVVDKLRILLDGFDEFPPVAIVLMGPFMKNYEDFYGLKKCLSTLGDIIDATTRLKKETHIVLVPAAEDPISMNVFPRPPLPEFLTEKLKKKCPKVHFASNPCRLQYCTQQIVVCRIDLITKLCRNTIKFPTRGNLDDHFTRTIVSQSTLAPLHPIALPILWDFDTAMMLYPLPDVVVIGDPSNSFHSRHHECTVINTGSFPKSKYSFKVYNASQRTVEDSEIPAENE